MKTRRGKRSESFWPSIVMKKWLNIQPKVYDFSEDEVDTETESDDDACSVKDVEVLADEEHARRIQGNLSVCATQTPGIRSKGCMSRHSRGKSETLRLQYINTKDVWVTIGTWNVAGRLPYDNIEIDEWLNMKEPADIYILGSHHSSGDLGSFWMDQDQRPENRDLLSDVSDEFSEEEDDFFLETSDVQHENGISKDGVKSRHNYIRIVSKQMVGIYVSVWVRRRLRRHINNLKVSPVGVGLMGYMGNKGSVSVSMSLFQTRLCFVCSHLTSGQKDGDEQRRNSDVHDILRRTRFSSVPGSDQPQTIPSHDQIFWFGDLNYRLNILDAEVRKLVATKQWDELLNSEQLSTELRSGRVFEGWKEGTIAFPPTYKYEINSDRYVGENPKEGEKKRSPAWGSLLL